MAVVNVLWSAAKWKHKGMTNDCRIRSHTLMWSDAAIISHTLVSAYQGSYRNLTVLYRLFQNKITSFSRLFKAFCLSLCEQNTMYSSILNTEWDSNFWILNIMNCKKINKCMGNQHCNRHLHFPGQHYSFQGFFQTFPCLWSFSRLFKALKISTLNSRIFHIFPVSVRTLLIVFGHHPKNLGIFRLLSQKSRKQRAEYVPFWEMNRQTSATHTRSIIARLPS